MNNKSSNTILTTLKTNVMDFVIKLTNDRDVHSGRMCVSYTLVKTNVNVFQ